MKCLREKGQGPRIDQYFLRSQSSQSNEIQRQEANHSSQDISTPVIDVRRTCMDTVSDEPNDPCEPDVWKFFTKEQNVKVKCAVCGVLMSFCGNTTNLRNHLVKQYPSEYDSGNTSKKQKESTPSVTAYFGKKVDPKSVRAK
ncbi:UNVERIFIED_CONTAM: hypothetical protein FKN15_037137 [Acipenser sinensis]